MSSAPSPGFATLCLMRQLPHPITVDGLLGSQGALTAYANACPPQGCPLMPMLGHSSSKTPAPQALTAPARTLPSTGRPPHTFVALTPTRSPPGGRRHPPCLGWAQNRAAVRFRCPPHSAQTPVPSSGPLWLVHPCGRYQVWRSIFLCLPNFFRATSFRNEREEKRKIP